MILGAIYFLTGCGDRIVLLRYQPPAGATPLSDAQAVTVFQFRDDRGSEGDRDLYRVGGVYGGYGNRLAKVMTDSPFTRTLSAALASAFQARGVNATSAADVLLTPEPHRF